VANHVKVVD